MNIGLGYSLHMNFLRRPFSRFFAPPRLPAIPPGMRVYAFGDVHGRADLLRILLDAIHEETSSTKPGWDKMEIIGLGDYLDRGPKSRDVLDMLIHASFPGKVTLTTLRGNHEEAFLTSLADPAAWAAWLEFGGSSTLVSYGVSPIAGTPTPDRVARMHEALVKAVPPLHLDFIRAMPTRRSLGDFLFVHAGIRPGQPLDRQNDQDLMWIREEFLASRRQHGAMIVHGHQVVEQPEFHPNRIAIDTGAYCTGRLTCLELEGTQQRLLHVTAQGIRRSVPQPR